MQGIWALTDLVLLSKDLCWCLLVLRSSQALLSQATSPNLIHSEVGSHTSRSPKTTLWGWSVWLICHLVGKLVLRLKHIPSFHTKKIKFGGDRSIRVHRGRQSCAYTG